VSDIERIPSMRKDAKQGVPKRKPRAMAKPEAESGKTSDAPAIPPRALAHEASLPDESTLPTEVAPDPEPATIAQSEPEPGADPRPQAEPDQAAEPELVAPPEPTPEVRVGGPPLTMRAMFARVEPAFHEFRNAAYGYPAEHMNDHIGDEGWTRKQMLSHIAAWHDLTTDRLIKMSLTGQPVPLDREQETINAAAARVALGKTAGEVLKDVEASYARLRRQMLRMTDADLRLGDGWAAERIASNTYAHYAEHMADLAPPVASPGSGAQR
jgi:hypothetical protein